MWLTLIMVQEKQRSSTKINFDRYYTYDELTDILHGLVRDHSGLAEIETIGKSYEGRDIWLLTVTDFKAGRPEDKPAIYVDGNIHAGEVTGSITALYLINHLLTAGDRDPRVKRLLETRTFYILPRANPDGAEKYLTTPVLLRSSVRPYPEIRKDEDPPGLQPEDVDGDGRILKMRIRDDQRGAWKVDRTDDRLMLPRSPRDLEGPFYHIFTEGLLRDHDGKLKDRVEWPFDVVPNPYGLDLNRNFPAGYNPLTSGAGPFPLSESETRAQVEFINSHPNIGIAILYHTTGGVIFRPHSTIPDKDFDKGDIALYEALGKMGTEATGYPVVCCYGDIWSGVLDDWCFEHKGIFAFTPELWDAIGRAAPDMKGNPVATMSEEDRQKLEFKTMQWNDRELAGKGFIRWQAFEHPQFGEVEIGGWDIKTCRQNPPTNFLEQECHKNIQLSLDNALSLPEAHIDEIDVTVVGKGAYRVSVLVSNHGYLSTNISKQALKMKGVRPDRLVLNLPEGLEVANGEEKTEIGFLQGYGGSQGRWFYYYQPPAKSMRRVTWTVSGGGDAGVEGGKPAKGRKDAEEIEVVLESQRGGTVRRKVSLADY